MSVSPSVLILDPGGSLIRRWSDALALDYQLETSRNAESLPDQLADWMPEALVIHVEAPHLGASLDRLRQISGLYPELPVVLVLGADLGPEQRLRLLALPLFAHLEADAPCAELELLLRRARPHARHVQERLHLRQRQLELDVAETGGSLGGLHEEIQQAAETDDGVMIYGRPGCGRLELAKKLHLLSRRAREPFVVFNPCGLSVEDCRVRLFGREGRDGLRRKGSLEIADGGTLLIEEVTRLPLPVQSELQRALSERRITRVGGIHSVPVDLRPLAAADLELVEMAREGEFNAELFGILHVFSLAVPDLRLRREDIPGLLRSYLRRFGRQLGKPELEIDPDLEQFLASEGWTGGIAELRLSVELAVHRAEGDKITMADFGVHGLDVELLPLNYRSAKKLVEMDFKRRFFARLLRMSRGKVTRAAEITGVPRPSLSTMIKDAGMEAASFKPPRKERRKAAAR